MAHSIQIPDGLWDLYDGSPSAMRDTLWQAKVTTPPDVELDPDPEPGTVIELRWATKCSVCRKRLMRGEQAVIRSRGDKTEIVCLDDGRQGLLDLSELNVGDFRDQ